jgi:D-alanine-D-alanine ligase
VTQRPVRVAVLHGGPSREHGISLKSGHAVADALASQGLGVLPVRIEQDGRWQLEGTTSALTGVADSVATALATLGDSAGATPTDVVFIVLHGAFGEDGVVQGLLESARVPYTGSGVAASSLAMDKERTKEVLLQHGLATAPWMSVDRVSWASRTDAFAADVQARLGFPVVVKPPREGSSFGLALAHDETELLQAVGACLDTPDGRALIERRVAGTEVSCPVLGNRGGPLRTLPIVEVVPDGEPFDFAAKYEGASQEICPARIDGPAAAAVREGALTAHRILGCDGVSRSDFIVDAGGVPWFLETNTIPGMTPESLCPLSARTDGISFPALCRLLVELALERAAGRSGRRG